MSAFLESCKTPLSIVKTSAKNNTISIPVADFAQSSYKLVRVSNYNYDIAVEKQQDGHYKALVLMCTHAGQPLTKTGETYYCTLHGSQFSHEGMVLKGPAEKDMISLKTNIENEFLLITLPA